MKKWITISLLSIFITLGACGDIQEKNPPTPNNDASLAADELIKQNCIDCHGGATDEVPGSHLSLAQLKEVILEGKGNMPAIELTDEEAEAIAAYLTK